MKRENCYLSTLAPDADSVAQAYGLGLEIAEFCTAWNMDEQFDTVNPSVCKKLEGISRSILHAPYNELFPCAIDKKARALAASRYRQAIALAKKYGCRKVVIHGGYNPWLFYPIWYVEQSILFWKEFFKEDPGIEIVLENILEPEPDMLLDIVKGVDHPNFRMCLDIGHVHAYSDASVMQWLEACGPWIHHLHIHNNDGKDDLHHGLQDGNLPIRELLSQIEKLCPHATITLEMVEAKPSVEWLMEEYQWNFAIG